MSLIIGGGNAVRNEVGRTQRVHCKSSGYARSVCTVTFACRHIASIMYSIVICWMLSSHSLACTFRN